MILNIMRYSLLVVALTSCCSSVEIIRDDGKYYFGDLSLVHSQYYYNYSYPRDIDEFISFVNNEDFPEIYNFVIRKLNKNMTRLNLEYKIRTKDSVLCCYLLMNKTIIYEAPIRSPCEDFDGEYHVPSFYFRNLFFDKQSKSINNDDIEQKFKWQIKEVKLQYKNVEKYSDTKKMKYVLLKYSREDGLNFFCEEWTQEFQNHSYIRDLEAFLDLFCKKNEVNQIIFATPILIDKK